MTSDTEGAGREDFDVEGKDRGANCRHGSHPENWRQKHKLMSACQIGSFFIWEGLPGGLGLRIRCPVSVGSGNSSLELVIECAQAGDAMLRLRRITVHIDTCLS